MPGFCADARGKRLAQWGPPGSPNYMKDTGRAMDRGRGMPEIPEHLREFYEKGPVRATVMAIGEDGTLTLASDAISRLRPGLRMALWRPETLDRKSGVPRDAALKDRIELIILGIAERQAIARACYLQDSVRHVRVGDRFTTGESWFSVAGMVVPRLNAPPPPPRKPEPPRLEEVSEGLRKALEEGEWPDGRRLAVGVGHYGLEYQVAVRDDHVIQEPLFDPFSRVTMPAWHESEAIIVWTPLPPNRKPVKLKEVREGLRNALEKARWPQGRSLAVGTGSGGTNYYASLRDGFVLIYQKIAANAISIPLPEPEGVVWRPILTENGGHRLMAVSEGLRQALNVGNGPEHPGRYVRYIAKGVGREGTEYRAHIWHDDRVVIDLAEDFVLTRCGFVEVGPDDRLSMRLPEPEGVVWYPLFPAAFFPSPLYPSRRPWWRFWK
jgi:uncharacterized protein YeaC (DUF1315 family)